VLADRRTSEPASEKDSWELDDVADRDELRSRFGMLLQELRVILPGVQILSAFLLTAAFSQRFGELDVWGRRAYGVALTASIISVSCLLAPTMLHRVGDRTQRARRLSWSVWLLLAGVVFLGVALISSWWGVARLAFGAETAWWMTVPLLLVMVALWLGLPLALRGRAGRRPARGAPAPRRSPPAR
jgi:hypothetical protein